MSRVVVLVATIPARKRSCERLLAELERQSRVPDFVILTLDGYGDAPEPACPLPHVAVRNEKQMGAGNRWYVGAEFATEEDILVCLDDDIMLIEAPRLVESLAAAVESGGAAAAMGRGVDGKQAPPGAFSRGNLIHAAACGLALHARHLKGLREFANEVKTAGGPDALGPLGDDDALVSAFLWKTNVPILHAATGNIFPAPGTQASSQTKARAAREGSHDVQKQAISKITGWPWTKRRSA